MSGEGTSLASARRTSVLPNSEAASTMASTEATSPGDAKKQHVKFQMDRKLGSDLTANSLDFKTLTFTTLLSIKFNF